MVIRDVGLYEREVSRRLSENAIFVQIDRFKLLIYKEIGFTGS